MEVLLASPDVQVGYRHCRIRSLGRGMDLVYQFWHAFLESWASLA